MGNLVTQAIYFAAGTPIRAIPSMVRRTFQPIFNQKITSTNPFLKKVDHIVTLDFEEVEKANEASQQVLRICMGIHVLCILTLFPLAWSAWYAWHQRSAVQGGITFLIAISIAYCSYVASQVRKDAIQAQESWLPPMEMVVQSVEQYRKTVLEKGLSVAANTVLEQTLPNRSGEEFLSPLELRELMAKWNLLTLLRFFEKRSRKMFDEHLPDCIYKIIFLVRFDILCKTTENRLHLYLMQLTRLSHHKPSEDIRGEICFDDIKMAHLQWIFQDLIRKQEHKEYLQWIECNFKKDSFLFIWFKEVLPSYFKEIGVKKVLDFAPLI